MTQFSTYLYFHLTKTKALYKIGITGGIGSGKSTVCAIFKTLGIAIFDADTEAKKLYDEDDGLKKTIIQWFGEGIYPDGLFNRKKLGEVVFRAPDKLKRLNELIHPMVRIQFEQWMTKQEGPYILKEAALLIESGSYKQLDEMILVSAPTETRIERVMKRDHANREEIIQRVNKQMSEEEKRPFCQYEIINDERSLLIPQVLHIHTLFLKNAAAARTV